MEIEFDIPTSKVIDFELERSNLSQSVQLDPTLTDSTKAAPADIVGSIKDAIDFQNETVDAIKEDIRHKFCSGEMFVNAEPNEILQQRYAVYSLGRNDNGTIKSWANADCWMYEVNAGDVYSIESYTSLNVPSAVFYNSDNFKTETMVSAVGVYDSSSIRTERITVPNGAVYMAVNIRTNVSQAMSVKQLKTVYYDTVKDAVESVETNMLDNYDADNLERMLLKAEKNNDFAWDTFDKPYFVFIQDDTNDTIAGFADVFVNSGVPLGLASIPDRITPEKLNVLKRVNAAGGEILAHYSDSPTDNSPDSQWLKCTKDIKRALEDYGFTVRGIIRAANTEAESAKGEKYCRRYFDYANDKMGRSLQYDLPRIKVWTYSTLDAFLVKVREDMGINGIHAYGFHGTAPDAEWVTPDAMRTVIETIKQNNNCVFTNYCDLFDTFGTTVLEKRISILEKSIQ